MLKFALMAFIALNLLACDKIGNSNNYQVISSSDGKVYRLNNKSGEIYVIENGTMNRISAEPRTKLVIGNGYETENGKVLKYLGKGQFKHKPISEFTDKELMKEIAN